MYVNRDIDRLRHIYNEYICGCERERDVYSERRQYLRNNYTWTV